ncbi:MAG TPA: hypothetical protein VJS65_05170 [Verrucomicrobiae bacterium]|nr:hypothetical protein [Verrucomicrobiae bacterium]
MRVTANTFPNALLNQLSSLGQRQNKLQSQAATGQIVSLPEDDPVAMRRILDMDTLEKLVSKEADADLTETIVRLTQTQTAYQAALQSAGRILGSSLLDYLR